jgi:arylsulfatase A-like enzyme
MKLNRLCFLLAAFGAAMTVHADLASLFTNVNANARTVRPRLPSIIFIQCHDLAPGDLSCYGQTNFQTPNLDRIAASGIRFTHYSGGEDSAATTAQLLAGTISAPAAGEPNLAQRLQAGGYHTGLIGEWSQAGQPWRLGFDEFAGFLDDAEGRSYYPDYIWRYDPTGIYTNNHAEPFVGRRMVFDAQGNTGRTYLPDLFTKAMVNYVKNNMPNSANHHRPFFLLVDFPAPRTAAAGADVFPVPSDAPFTEEPWPQAAKNRAALITRLDDNLGRLFEQLAKSRMTNNVAIFFAGSSAPEKFADTNLNFLLPAAQFRDAQKPAPQNLPLLAIWPGWIPPGQVANLSVSPLDIAPTALDIAWMKPVPEFAGISLLPLLEGLKGTNLPAVLERRLGQAQGF